jgi:hypothetical protein
LLSLSLSLSVAVPEALTTGARLLDLAPHYYDMSNFPDCEAKIVLKRILQRKELAKRMTQDGQPARR